MSDDDNNEKCEDDKERPSAGPGCFWNRSGRCFLEQLTRHRIISILGTTPVARKDLLKCDGVCVDEKDDYIEFAEAGRRSVSEREQSDTMQKRFNQHQDRHREMNRSTSRGPRKSKKDGNE